MIQLIYATGCVTPVGLDAMQTCAAIRARQSGVEAVMPNAGEPLLAARVPARAALIKSPPRWLAELALRALRPCLRAYRGRPERLALFLALPEPFRGHAVTLDGSGHGFSSRLVKALGVQLSTHSRVLFEGHASTALALEAAETLLARNEIDAALIGGVDSLLGEADRERLRQAGRLHEPGHPFGLIPGEGAAFFVVGRVGGPFTQPPIASLLGVGHAHEADHLLTQRYSVGAGLQQAIRVALQRAGADESVVEWRVTDLNGERHRSWESTALLARQYRAWRDGLPCLHVPAYTGDLGCASLALQVVVAAHAMQDGGAPGPGGLCESSSEGALRGACLVGPAPGVRPPPFRQVVVPAMADRRPVIRSQLARLPNELAWLVDRRRVSLRHGLETLATLEQFDERLDAHLAWLRTTGSAGADALASAAEEAGPGGYFAPMLLAIESADAGRVVAVLAAAAASGGEHSGLRNAFGWAPSQMLKGLISTMAQAADAPERRVAAAAVHMHRVSPGALLQIFLQDNDPSVRHRALRMVGELGQLQSLERIRPDLQHAEPRDRFLAARSALLLGDRRQALDVLSELAAGATPEADAALHLLLRSTDVLHAHRVVAQIAADASAVPHARRLVAACGALGDPHFVPWLIAQMAHADLARLAAESFVFITGQSLAAAGLDRRTADAAAGDAPDSTAPEGEADDGLPWPDPSAVAAWWREQGGRFAPKTRYFMGASPSRQGCAKVLATGVDRQRRVAAEYLCLLGPGTPLFNTSAPAWRQRRALEAVGG